MTAINLKSMLLQTNLGIERCLKLWGMLDGCVTPWWYFYMKHACSGIWLDVQSLVARELGFVHLILPSLLHNLWLACCVNNNILAMLVLRPQVLLWAPMGFALVFSQHEEWLTSEPCTKRHRWSWSHVRVELSGSLKRIRLPHVSSVMEWYAEHELFRLSCTVFGKSEFTAE